MRVILSQEMRQGREVVTTAEAEAEARAGAEADTAAAAETPKM
jgi:hypothetical protein